MSRKSESLEALVEKHFPCVGCEPFFGTNHHPSCPVNYRYRAERLVMEALMLTSSQIFKILRCDNMDDWRGVPRKAK